MTRSPEFELVAVQLSQAAVLGTSLCEPLLRVLPVDGASVSTLVPPFEVENVSATDAVSARMDQYQLDLGQGPCWQALERSRPTVVHDLRDAGDDWPLFHQAVSGEDIHAVYAFPLTVGALDIGAVDLYAQAPGSMGPEQIENAAELAHIIATQVLQQALDRSDASADGSGDPRWFSRREVHQATGMLMARFRVAPDDALVMLRAQAFALGRPVLEVARDLVAGSIDFPD